MKIDQKTQNYLLRHDGQIDFWPDGSGFHCLSTDGDKFYFHYFGSAYETEYSSYSIYYDHAHRRMPGLEYHNEYVSDAKPASTEYKVDKTKESLKEQMNRARSLARDIEKSYRARVIALVFAGIFRAFVIVSILANLLFGVEGPITFLLTVVSKWMLDEGFSLDPYLGLCIICLVLSPLGIWGCIAEYFNNRDYIKAAEKAEQAYREYVDGHYEEEMNANKEKAAETTQTRKNDIEMASDWHRVWFEWAKQVGDCPEDAPFQ